MLIRSLPRYTHFRNFVLGILLEKHATRNVAFVKHHLQPSLYSYVFASFTISYDTDRYPPEDPIHDPDAATFCYFPRQLVSKQRKGEIVSDLVSFGIRSVLRVVRRAFSWRVELKGGTLKAKWAAVRKQPNICASPDNISDS